MRVQTAVLGGHSPLKEASGPESSKDEFPGGKVCRPPGTGEQEMLRMGAEDPLLTPRQPRALRNLTHSLGQPESHHGFFWWLWALGGTGKGPGQGQSPRSDT